MPNARPGGVEFAFQASQICAHPALPFAGPLALDLSLPRPGGGAKNGCDPLFASSFVVWTRLSADIED
jgi:hypothetical protein